MTRTSLRPYKVCGCGVTYRDSADFLARTDPLRRSDGTEVRHWPEPALLAGNCACGSTICAPAEVPS